MSAIKTRYISVKSSKNTAYPPPKTTAGPAAITSNYISNIPRSARNIEYYGKKAHDLSGLVLFCFIAFSYPFKKSMNGLKQVLYGFLTFSWSNVIPEKGQTTIISIILFISAFVSPQDIRKFSQPDCNEPSPKPFI